MTGFAHRPRAALTAALLVLLTACAQQDALTPDTTVGQPEAQDPSPVSPVADRAGQPPVGKLATRELGIASAPATPASNAFFPGQVPYYESRERYPEFTDNGVRLAREQPVSTFSIDVDTASYANVRRLLNAGTLPPADAVRVEELINYFRYDYAPPPDRKQPFSVHYELAPSPWSADRTLLHLGIQGYQLSRAELPPVNLVFLVDVSGSMQAPNKLSLLKPALRLLAERLGARDRLSIAVYAGAAGTVLESTRGDNREPILRAIDGLEAGGSTNGGAGIQLAYSLARQGFLPDGINRIVLATDGDFNVGTTDIDALKSLIERERASGVSLSVLGFGAGNYYDALMQELAQNGDGNAAYIDTLNEARKVLIDEISGTLATIARDVKIQIEFNPQVVAEYRLIGYETRHLEREDFNNDNVDAGDIGAGHSVTALYELTLTGAPTRIEPLRYQREATAGTDADEAYAGELAYLRIRHKMPGARVSKLQAFPLRLDALRADLAATSDDFRFSAAVAGFGQLLRGSEQLQGFGYEDALNLALGARGADPFGYRGEFVSLVRTAEALDAPRHTGNTMSGTAAPVQVEDREAS
ncbi:MAG: VWA domain-containing protein [Pseudomonadales bacterium]